MKNTYQMMKALVTLPPVGETISDLAGNTRIYGGEYKVHIAAVDQNWTAQGFHYFDEPILMRDLKIQGFSSTTWVVSEKIMVPDGYRIIAMLVDENGIPLSNETLHLELEELPRTGWSLNKSGEAHIAGEPDSLQVEAERVGQNFINDAYIQGSTICNAKIDTAIVSGKPAGKSDNRLMENAEGIPDQKAVILKDNAYVFSGRAIASKVCLSDDMREAVIDAVRNSEVFQSLVVQLNALSAERESDAVSVRQKTEQVVNDAIRNALKPGGSLYGGR